MVSQQLIDYIKQQLEQGMSDEQIRQSLLANNWQLNDIEESLSVLRATSTEQSSIVFSNAKPKNKLGKIVGVIIILVALIVTVAFGFFIWKTQNRSQISAVSQSEENSKTSQNQQASNTQQSAKVATISIIVGKFTLPEKFVNLANIEGSNQRNFDENGCKISTADMPPGFICVKKDTNGDKGVIFSTLFTNFPSPYSQDFDNKQTQDKFFKELASTLRANPEPDRNITEDYTPFLEYPAFTFTTKNASGSIQREVYFIKNKKLYTFSLGASETTFNLLWPDIVNTMKTAKYSE